jgi:hypothetical protein
MGVDIYGRAPRSEAGRYFGINWGGWRPIAEHCIEIAPDLCKRMKPPTSWISDLDGSSTPMAELTVSPDVVKDPLTLWFTNDYYGLDDADAQKLVDAIEASLSSDAVKYQDALLAQQDQRERAKGKGLKLSDGRLLMDAAPDLLPSGKTWFIEWLQMFAGFLRDSGGFEIH